MKDGTKRALAWILSIVGLVLLVPMILFVVMVVAPGVEIFGIKYVSATVGKFEQKIDRSDLYNKNIHLQTNSVPVTITFGEGSGSYGVEFVQHFQGLTKAKNTANVQILNSEGGAYTGTGDVYIKVNEFKKFIWANSAQTFYLKLKLPSSYITSGKIYVDSNSSDVTFSSTSGTRNINTIDISTSGLIKFDTTFNVTGTCTLRANGEITVGEKLKVSGGINIKTDNASVKIKESISGNIDFESNSGTLEFVSCAALNAKTYIGNITCSSVVNGNVNIETIYGDVNIPSIGGSNNTISSTYGDVNIPAASVGNITVKASRGNVTLGTVNTATVTTSTGNITISRANGNLTLTASGGGNVNVKDAVYGNAAVTTGSGNVVFEKTIGGNLNVTTSGGQVKFVYCKNLIANTKGGSISAFEENNTVAANANITTTSGNVNIVTVSGDSNTIKTNRGNITVGTLGGVSTIESYNGSVTIGSTDTVTITSAYSPVIVGAVAGSINVTTNANVAAGSSVGSVGNATIFAGSGEITLVNTLGTIQACSNNKVNLTNTSSTKININCEYNANGVRIKTYNGAVEATGLKGIVNIYSNSVKNVDLTFAAITNNVSIDLGGACQNAFILVNGTSYGSVSYSINSKTTCYAYLGDEQVLNGQNIIYNAGSGSYRISASSSSGVPITLKFAG